MDLTQLEDGACVALAVNDSQRAIEELVRRHTPGLYRLHRRLLGAPEAAEDATQETFLRAFGALESFDPERRFKTWLYAVAWNFARDQLRRRKRRHDEAGARAAGPHLPEERFDDRTTAPHTALEQKEAEEWLHRALSELRPPQRALLCLRELDGISYLELAELFECRIGTIKSRVHRARMELKDVLLRLRPDLFDG